MTTKPPSADSKELTQLQAELPLPVTGGSTDRFNVLSIILKFIIKIESGTVYNPATTFEFDYLPTPSELATLYDGAIKNYTTTLDKQLTANPDARTYVGSNEYARASLASKTAEVFNDLNALATDTLNGNGGTSHPNSKIKISLGISFRPLTITISVEF
jgi:hypothetical protein